MIDSNEPRICYENLLQGDGYTILLGEDDTAAPLSNAWLWDMSRIAMPRADANGVLSFTVNTPAGVGFGMDDFGFTPFGHGSFGGKVLADVLILGASRNSPGGFRFTGGNLQVLADGVEVFNRPIYEPINTSVIYSLTEHTAASTYSIIISGLSAEATVLLPEIYIGPSLLMPYIDQPFNANGEHAKRTVNEYATGRIKTANRFRRMEMNPKWSDIELAQQFEIHKWLENSWEAGELMWWAWSPQSKPTAVYMGRHHSDKAPMPFQTGMYADFAMKFVEAL